MIITGRVDLISTKLIILSISLGIATLIDHQFNFIGYSINRNSITSKDSHTGSYLSGVVEEMG